MGWIKLQESILNCDKISPLSDVYQNLLVRIWLYSKNKTLPGVLLTSYGGIAKPGDIAMKVNKSPRTVQKGLELFSGERELLRKVYLNDEVFVYVVHDFLEHQASYEKYNKRNRERMRSSILGFKGKIKPIMNRSFEDFLKEVFLVQGIGEENVGQYIDNILNGVNPHTSNDSGGEKESPAKKLILDPYIEENGGVEILFRIYNKFRCGKMPKAEDFTESRRAKCRTRLAEVEDQIEFIKKFTRAVKQAASNPFLNGSRPGKNHHRWKCNFDWLITNDKNYLKIIEGNYDDNGSVRRLVENGETPPDAHEYQ